MTNNSAGFWVRLGAALLDGIILTITLGFVSLLIYNQFFMEGFSFIDILNALYFLLLPIFWYGYTIGKRALGIRIVRIDEEEVGFGTMFLREIVSGLVYVLTFGIGLIVSAFMVGIREDNRSIHDFIAGTYVTYEKP
ncbi:RDD family protein [Oceanobacillus polygoni]|uniref:RDD family membrane protein YckC n=1 Tax=Oceanobacillus polygoni TaxID=1235259 RepID=A0A9X1CK95_9BACI|nr:RDD family protein [Oceanobacillus polygoni]MBP2079272.1 putative RDD family membrane protein YckC [Oceanobacillus polygoni]